MKTVLTFSRCTRHYSPNFLMFLFLGINIAATYYLQSTLHNKMAMVVALLRSLIISGLLPIFMGVLGVWLAMPIGELVVTVVALCYIRGKT